LDSEEVQLAFLNHKEVPLDTLLHEGDEVALSPKTGGM
jgi:molybdopterin converting factor small subunit